MRQGFKIAAVVWALALVPVMAVAQQLTFYHTVTGEPLPMDKAPEEGRDTPAVKHFLQTGENPYNEVKNCLKKGEEVYLVACSGCHGHVGEGKIGPGLNDNYWTYPKGNTDKGLFETIFGGAKSMMGPHWDLQLDETLKLMAWIRHFYHGPIEDAVWLTDGQKATFVQFDPKNPQDAPEPEGECEIPAQ